MSDNRRYGTAFHPGGLGAPGPRGLATSDAERVRRALAASLSENTRRAYLGHLRAMVRRAWLLPCPGGSGNRGRASA